jgi:hypothetical protein
MELIATVFFGWCPVSFNYALLVIESSAMILQEAFRRQKGQPLQEVEDREAGQFAPCSRHLALHIGKNLAE